MASPLQMVSLSPRSKAMLPRNYHENRKVEEVSFQVLYTRHSLTGMVVFVAYVLYFAFQDNRSYEENLRSGALGLCFLVLVLGSMIFPSGPFIRPHPLFWRLIFTLSVIYMGALMFFVFLSPDQMRKALQILDPKLGVHLPPILYAEEWMCYVSWENISARIDIFTVAHFVGWVLKAMIFRDRLLLWGCSILWEFIEISTAYFIPNFAECWWDQWILDVLLCNGLGIEAGLWYLRTFETSDEHAYNWLPFMNIQSLGQKCKRSFQQFFTPERLVSFEWESSEMHYRLFYYGLNILVASTVDINVFVLKLWLWIPTDHPITLARTFLIGLCSFVMARQFYFFVSDDKCDYLGSQTWVVLGILFLESVISFKCAPDPFPSAPFSSKVIWACCGVVWATFSFLALQKWKKLDSTIEKKEH